MAKAKTKATRHEDRIPGVAEYIEEPEVMMEIRCERCPGAHGTTGVGVLKTVMHRTQTLGYSNPGVKVIVWNFYDGVGRNMAIDTEVEELWNPKKPQDICPRCWREKAMETKQAAVS